MKNKIPEVAIDNIRRMRTKQTNKQTSNNNNNRNLDPVFIDRCWWLVLLFSGSNEKWIFHYKKKKYSFFSLLVWINFHRTFQWYWYSTVDNHNNRCMVLFFPLFSVVIECCNYNILIDHSACCCCCCCFLTVNFPFCFPLNFFLFVCLYEREKVNNKKKKQQQQPQQIHRYPMTNDDVHSFNPEKKHDQKMITWDL